MMMSLFCNCPRWCLLPVWILTSSFCCISSRKLSIASCPGSLHDWCGRQAVCCRGIHISASVPSAIWSLILNPCFPFLPRPAIFSPGSPFTTFSKLVNVAATSHKARSQQPQQVLTAVLSWQTVNAFPASPRALSPMQSTSCCGWAHTA